MWPRPHPGSLSPKGRGTLQAGKFEKPGGSSPDFHREVLRSPSRLQIRGSPSVWLREEQFPGPPRRKRVTKLWGPHISHCSCYSTCQIRKSRPREQPLREVRLLWSPPAVRQTGLCHSKVPRARCPRCLCTRRSRPSQRPRTIIFCFHRYFVFVMGWGNELLQSTAARNNNTHCLTVSIGQSRRVLPGSLPRGPSGSPPRRGPQLQSPKAQSREAALASPLPWSLAGPGASAAIGLKASVLPWP